TVAVPAATDPDSADAPTARVGAEAAAGGSTTAASGPRTLPDLPTVPAAAGSGGFRWRAPLLGVAAAVLIAALGLAAALAFRPEKDTPVTDATSPATPSVAPSVASTPKQEEVTSPEPEQTRYRPVRPTHSQTSEPSAEPSAPAQEPE